MLTGRVTSPKKGGPPIGRAARVRPLPGQTGAAWMTPGRGASGNRSQAVDSAPSTGLSRAPLACIKGTPGRSGLFNETGLFNDMDER